MSAGLLLALLRLWEPLIGWGEHWGVVATNDQRVGCDLKVLRAQSVTWYEDLVSARQRHLTVCFEASVKCLLWLLSFVTSIKIHGLIEAKLSRYWVRTLDWVTTILRSGAGAGTGHNIIWNIGRATCALKLNHWHDAFRIFACGDVVRSDICNLLGKSLRTWPWPEAFVTFILWREVNSQLGEGFQGYCAVDPLSSWLGRTVLGAETRVKWESSILWTGIRGHLYFIPDIVVNNWAGGMFLCSEWRPVSRVHGLIASKHK